MPEQTYILIDAATGKVITAQRGPWKTDGEYRHTTCRIVISDIPLHLVPDYVPVYTSPKRMRFTIKKKSAIDCDYIHDDVTVIPRQLSETEKLIQL